jgi:hypothetical protein
MRLFALIALLSGLAAPSGPAAASAPARTDVVTALSVLHDWDDRRAVAWARSDAAELSSLYVPGSAAGRADVRLLRSYTARGLVVRRLETQVFGVRVVHRSSRRVVLRVLDRVAGGVVEEAGRETPLPSTRPVVRRVELLRGAEDWQVASVTGWG